MRTLTCQLLIGVPVSPVPVSLVGGLSHGLAHGVAQLAWSNVLVCVRMLLMLLLHMLHHLCCLKKCGEIV